MRWTAEKDAALRAAWLVSPKARDVAAATGFTLGQVGGRAMRLNLHAEGTDDIIRLPRLHPAMRDMRTIFPARVREPYGVDVLKSGKDSRKLGSVVEKGPWRGMPIYSLTLEERKTCPKDCPVLDACMGNGMNWSARFRHGPALEARLSLELPVLSWRHRRTGFVVRLHVLGDFYSVDYVKYWAAALKKFPGLRIWGYTARKPDSPIGAAIVALPFDRAAIRFSSADLGPRTAVTMSRVAAAALRPGQAIICPVEGGKTRSCATCGLCWAAAAIEKPIVFLLHGNPGKGRPRKDAARA